MYKPINKHKHAHAHAHTHTRETNAAGHVAAEVGADSGASDEV
jgi:hypothetical protein